MFFLKKSLLQACIYLIQSKSSDIVKYVYYLK